MQEFTKDMNIILALPDTPPLSAQELKSKFDEGGLAIKRYINEMLLPELESAAESVPSIVDSLTSSDTNAALSAAQGKLLKNSIEVLNQQINLKQNIITYGTANPSGGSNGDIYLQY